MKRQNRTTGNEILISKLETIDDTEQRRRFLSRNPALLSPEVAAKLADRVRELVRVDVQQSLRAAEAALAIATKLDDKASLALALRARANAIYSQGNYADAVQIHEQAIAIFDSLGNQNEVARTLSSVLQPLLLLGEYTRAFKAAERARKIFASHGNTWRLARLEINVGNIYSRQDRFQEAIDCYERAYQGLLQHNDAEGIAAALSNMATYSISLNDFSKALDAHTKARKLCEQRGMPLLVLQADYNIAYLYFLRGEYSRAIRMLRTARQNAKTIGDAYHLALCSLDLAELYLELNLSSEAAELAQQGYDGFRKLNMGYESAKCLAFSAMAAGQLGHGFESLKLFSESREMFVKEKNQVWPSLIDLYRALIFFNEGRFFEARRHCAEALDSFEQFGLISKSVLAELLLTRIALRTEETQAALAHATAALNKVEALQSPVLSYQANLLMGNVRAVQKDVSQAYESYCRAHQAIETLRGNLRNDELKVAFIKNRLEVYENLVDICLMKGATEEAFAYLEQAKSRNLMDLFIKPVPTIVEKASGQSQLVRTIRDLREELNWYYNRIEREQLQPEQQSSERISTLQKQAQKQEKELIRVLQEASETDADEAGLQMPSHVPLAQIRKTIPENTMVVEYFRVRDRILVCLLDRQSLAILPVTFDSRITSLLRLLQFQLSKFRLGTNYLSTFENSLAEATQSHLKELYDELLAPIASQLTAKHLIFVPHGSLHYVPFHALFDGKEHVVDRHTVSYSPSASIFALGETRTANTTGSALILGIPDAQAPAIADEVRSLKSVVKQAELFIGDQATEQVLRTQGPSSRIVHIATHGRFRQDNPMFSAIRLGNSFLSLFDLYQLKLPVDLVTLSGCSTGLNIVAAGDELIGLARGLLHAGARSLVLSLWEVHDKSTAEFMTSFYRRLGEGQGKADAMQAAMLDVRSTYPHCFQWAPFILAGRP